MGKESTPFDPPTVEDWDFLRAKFNTDFSPEFVAFIDLMAIYAFPGEILNVARGGCTNGNDQITTVYEAENTSDRWNRDMIPFYAIGNGDYFCLSACSGQHSPIFYHYHENGRDEKFADSFEMWLKNLRSLLT